MIPVNDFYESTMAIANKDAGGFQAGPDEWNIFMVNALRETYNYIHGLMSRQVQGDKTPEVAMESTRIAAEAARYLHEDRIIPLVSGKVEIPNGTSVQDENGEVCPEFRHLKTIFILYVIPGTTQTIKYACRVVETQHLQDNLTNSINAPHYTQPIAHLEDDHYQIFAGSASIAFVEMTYERQYIKPVWAFTVDDTLPEEEQREVYDPTNSVDIDLPDFMFTYMQERCLEQMGIRQRDPDIVSSSVRRTALQ